MSKAIPDAIVAAFGQLVRQGHEGPLLVSPGQEPIRVGEIDALARAAERALAGLRSIETPMGLVAPNGPGFLAGFLALRRQGAITLLLDAQAPPSELRRVAATLGAGALLVCSEAWPHGPAAFTCEALTPMVAPGYPAGTTVVKVTSGSTGEPRGVAVSSEALIADDAALATTMGLVPAERIVAALPMSHSYGFSSVVLPALVRGSTLVLPAPTGPLSALAAAHEAGATFFPTVPAYLQALLKISRPPAWPSTLRRVVSAGAPLSPDTAVSFRKTYGLPVHTFYGASECGGICYDREGGAGERGSVGPPVDGVRVTLDSSGRKGEGVVSVASPAVALGYHDRSETRLFGGRFETSDVAGWAGSELRLLRRIGSVINVRGRNVDPSEIERVVSTLPGVLEVVAIGVPDPGAGEHLLRVVIACGTRPLAYADVLAHCRAQLPDHKVPRSIFVVAEIPRTARGKVDRKALLVRDSENRLDG
jgi:long-chain acyl-CoA synthetase